MYQTLRTVLLLLSLVIPTESTYITAGRWLDEFKISSEDEVRIFKHSLALAPGSKVSPF